ELRDGRRPFVRGNSSVPRAIEPFHAELKTCAELVERAVGGPSAVDWLWDGEQLWVLGARKLESPEAALAARSEVARWNRSRWLERFPDRLSPLGWSLVD